MNIWLTTVDLEALSKYDQLFDIHGVIVEAVAFSQSGYAYEELLEKFLAHGRYVLSLPLSGKSTSDLIKQAEYLCSLSDRIVVQVPMTLEGLGAGKTLYRKGVPFMNSLTTQARLYITSLIANYDYFYCDVEDLKDLSRHPDGPIILAKGTIKDQLALHTNFELVLDIDTLEELIEEQSTSVDIMNQMDPRKMRFLDAITKGCCEKKSR